MGRKPANAALRSQYSLRLCSWVNKYVAEGSQTISLDELRRVFGLESIKDPEGNVIKEAPLPIWANFQQRALKLASMERSKHRRVVALKFTIKTQSVPRYEKNGDASLRL
jgi:hypothetical protein